MSALRLAVLLALAPAAAWAGPAANGAAVLRRSTSARAVALGGAFSAYGGGLDSLAANPAGVAAAERPELESTFTSGVADDTFGFLGYAHPLKAGVAVGGFTYYDGGKMNAVDQAGDVQSVTAERDYVAQGGWAMPLARGLSVGAVAKAYKMTLAQSASASGFAADAGARWVTPVPGLSLGAAVQNAGPGVKFEQDADPLPTTARAGAAWRHMILPPADLPTYYTGLRATLSAEAVKTRGETTGGAFGAEFALEFDRDAEAAIRVSEIAGRPEDGLGFGVGLRAGRFILDYALATKKDLGMVQNASLRVLF